MPKSEKMKLLSTKPLSIIDWIIFSFFAILCYLSFQQGDIIYTASSSITYLQGHILDFYDYNVQFGGNNYMPSTYILFAIWNIPVKLLGLKEFVSSPTSLTVIMWYKLLPTLFYMASGYLVYKIAQTVGMGDHKAKLCGYAFLAMPIGFFSQFIFGQYDSFTLFFMLLGVLFFYKKKWFRFAIFFGISLTFKYFPLLIFIPLLLMVEKRIWHIIKYCCVVMIPMALVVLVYFPSHAFKAGVGGFGAVGYVFQVGFSTPYFAQSLVVVAWLAIAAFAYFHELSENDDIVKWSIYFANLVTFLIFGMSMWHPQWLLLGVPFWVLGTFLTKKFDIFMILEVAMMLFFVLFTTNFWINHVDQALFNFGVFGEMLGGRISDQQTIRGIYRIHNLNILYSLFSGALLVSTVFKHPKLMVDKISESVDHFWGWARFRIIAGISIFVVPAFICFFIAMSSPYVLFDSGAANDGNVGELVAGREVSQTITAVSDSILQVEVLTGTYARTNDADLTLDIINLSTNETIESVTVDTSTFVDNSYNEIDIDPVTTEPGQKYALVFSSDNATEGDSITIYQTPEETASEGVYYATVDDDDTDYNLCVKVFGDKAS